MNKYKKSVIVVLISIFLFGCGAKYTIPEEDFKTSDYPAYKEINDVFIKTYIPYRNLKDVDFIVYVTISNRDGDAFEKLTRVSLKRIGFEYIYSPKEFADYLKSNGLGEYSHSWFDPITLNKIRKNDLRFLVIYFRQELVTQFMWESELTIIDPESGSYLLDMYKYDAYLLDFDKEFTYPAFNLINKWYIDSIM